MLTLVLFLVFSVPFNLVLLMYARANKLRADGIEEYQKWLFRDYMELSDQLTALTNLVGKVRAQVASNNVTANEAYSMAKEVLDDYSYTIVKARAKSKNKSKPKKRRSKDV